MSVISILLGVRFSILLAVRFSQCKITQNQTIEYESLQIYLHASKTLYAFIIKNIPTCFKEKLAASSTVLLYLHPLCRGNCSGIKFNSSVFVKK